MFRGKMREGITRIQGDILLETMSGETVVRIHSLNLDRSTIFELAAKPEKEGRYRLALYGTMTLSTGEKRPFITKSFPFEVKL
jgi:hypothetical protein